ncbi:protein SENSITIVE TO UV 2-like isoform X1 [Dioscorea cayenensis subsp. rotundata]|uniref:Protein SENSITIVE TO UV 2-like isoform X1 n=1 Tax=Dioscorea cayennensis subsp. rotundata TaxID=55577 RepID=A0AB40CTX5_DIOCR|nr:protein SENSITIVE TO UV 2-like isoform X1 [Dioscorea cayenensis subsp. rotundata]
MQQIASGKVEQKAQILAFSIMNLIWSQSEPNVVREKTGLLPLLECMSQLLQKDAGLLVQMHAVRLLFSVLNCTSSFLSISTCPKVLLMLNCGTSQDISALEGVISCVLEGLARTLVQARTGPQDVKYQKQVIILLAFIASSGKSGFDVLISSGRNKGVNFLELIMQVLSSGMNTAEIADSVNFEDLDLHKLRSSLVREALILLNRLASHPALSKFTLEALTCSNTVTSLTVDVVTRLCRKNKPGSKNAGAGRITNFAHTDAEIIELARLFRTRFFAFLGCNLIASGKLLTALFN